MKTEDFNLNKLPKKSVFKTPDSFFEANESRILQKIEAEEYPERNTILANIPKINIYHVPDHYFSRLYLRIKTRIMKKDSEKLMFIPYYSNYKYALASVFVLALSLVGFYKYSTRIKPEVFTESSLSHFSDSDVIEYLEHSEVTIDDEDFLSYNHKELNYIIPKAALNDKKEIEDALLDNISEDDLLN